MRPPRHHRRLLQRREQRAALRRQARHPSCRQNFLHALAPYGLGKKDIVANLNWFMNVPVGPDGAMDIVDGISKPGDYVDLRAEMDVLAVISNCPQMSNPCNGFNPDAHPHHRPRVTPRSRERAGTVTWVSLR